MTSYTGSVYIGVVGGELDLREAWQSVTRIHTRPGDEGPHYYTATKGYEARQKHLNNFLQSRCDFALFLDHDMYFEPDTLERLRSHKLPYVSGLYMRRSVNPLAPVWYRPYRGKWPLEPWVGPVERGKLHHIGASGWGCVLVHREVVTAVQGILCGELEVLEDDMDIYPYDLAAVLAAIRGLNTLIDERPSDPILWPALKHHAQTLAKQIRPLTGMKAIVGSDVRFPVFASMVGHKLFGDPDVRPRHNIHFGLSPDDYEQFDLLVAQKDQERITRREQAKWQVNLRELTNG
jgi:hypothetical protein